jgi:F0F1-type ATP synthase membrane subunit b/b'
MSLREAYIRKMQDRLNELKDQVHALREKADQTETNLELEYYTLIDELQVKLETANQRFQLLKEGSEENWEELKTEFELIWNSLRELIKSITSP